MKLFRKLALAALLTALLTGTCLARETFHGAYLQGFPDGWTNVPDASDSPRYKALGNSVAVPCVMFLMQGIRYAVDHPEKRQ